ncbi:MAG TPA: hypothetical protein VK956_02285, partial [Verrucomicrobium sp.]|nr:hypothetical protein [Verrucomicrobium sp.]
MVIQENNAIRIGIVGSLTVHLLLFLSVGLWMSMAPARSALPLQTREELEQETTLIFPDDLPPEVAAEPKPEPEPKVTPPPVPQDSQKYVRTTQNADVPEAPANAPFVSDRNTVASSRLLPEKGGDANLPTTRGVDIPTMELTNRDYKDGEIKNDAAGAPPAPSAPTVAPLTLVPPTPPAPRAPATPPRPAPAAPV